MEFETILQAISTIGFPVVVALVCMWYVKKQNDQHKEETDSLAEAVRNNTLVLQRLVDRIDRTGGANNDA